MKYLALVFMLLLSCQVACSEEVNPDLPELLDKMSTICGDRWDISLGDEGWVYINSKEKVLGEMAGYNFPLGEKLYKIHSRFKIVETIDSSKAKELRNELKKLRAKANNIEHTAARGYYHYKPKGKEQWALVSLIKKIENKIEDIPEYKYKSIYLSEGYSMTFFKPNEENKKALQYKADIEKLYKLLEKSTPKKPEVSG